MYNITRRIAQPDKAHLQHSDSLQLAEQNVCKLMADYAGECDQIEQKSQVRHDILL